MGGPFFEFLFSWFVITSVIASRFGSVSYSDLDSLDRRSLISFVLSRGFPSNFFESRQSMGGEPFDRSGHLRSSTNGSCLFERTSCMSIDGHRYWSNWVYGRWSIGPKISFMD